VPRTAGSGKTSEPGYVLTGIYKWLRLQEGMIRQQPDPRELWWVDDLSLPRSAAANHRDGFGLLPPDLAAGWPVVVGRGRILGYRPEMRHTVDMFMDPTNVRFKVTKTDRVTVAAHDYGSVLDPIDA
jgi:hypothetical protein